MCIKGRCEKRVSTMAKGVVEEFSFLVVVLANVAIFLIATLLTALPDVYNSTFEKVPIYTYIPQENACLPIENKTDQYELINELEIYGSFPILYIFTSLIHFLWVISFFNPLMTSPYYIARYASDDPARWVRNHIALWFQPTLFSIWKMLTTVSFSVIATVNSPIEITFIAIVQFLIVVAIQTILDQTKKGTVRPRKYLVYFSLTFGLLSSLLLNIAWPLALKHDDCRSGIVGAYLAASSLLSLIVYVPLGSFTIIHYIVLESILCIVSQLVVVSILLNNDPNVKQLCITL